MDWFLYDNGLRHERLKIEDIYCYHICKHTFEIFNIKKNCSRNLMMSKNRVENEMIIICKDCCDFVQRIFYLVKRNYFNEIKKCLVKYYSKNLEEKSVKIRSDSFDL